MGNIVSEVIIAKYVRSPFTPAKKGLLKDIRADDLASQTIKKMLENVSLEKIAAKLNYKEYKITSESKLIKILKQIKNKPGPIFLLVKISKSKEQSSRVSCDPEIIRNRFMESLW